MKHLLPIAVIVILFACKKEKEHIEDNTPPRIVFTEEDKNWFIYSPGQDWKFKNDKGDSMVYKAMLITQNFLQPEYKDTSVIAYTQSYRVRLESASDSIILYFYKEYQSDDPNKLRANFRWTTMRGQLIRLAAIENNAPFNRSTVNGVTYTKVTPTVPISDATYSWTLFDKAYYDQSAGFIEIIDINGVSWKKV